MNFLLFQLQRLLMLPVRLITSPMELFAAFSDGDARSTAFLKGLPAVVIAAVGSLAVASMSLGGKTVIVDRYSRQLQESTDQQKFLQGELQTAIISQNSLGSGGDGSDAQALRDKDPRSKEIEKLIEQSDIYLRKLVELQPDQQEFKYQMALRAFAEGDVARCFSLMNQIAPLDTPGYPKAHLQLALRFENLPSKTVLQKISYIDMALKHVDNCLINDIDNLDALKVRANLLSQKGSKEDALVTYKKIFARDAKFFAPLLKFQTDPEERQTTLGTASGKFLEQLKSSEVQKDSGQWVTAWQGYSQTMAMMEEFSTLEERLLAELDRYKDSSDNLARLPLLKQYLAQTYISWAMSLHGNILETDLAKMTEAQQLDLLDYFSKAFSYNEANPSARQAVSRLTFSSYPAVEAKARKIYDPQGQGQGSLPSEVLNQLGVHALRNKDYKAAQRHYESARALSPNSPAILNNLAFAYLEGEDEGGSGNGGLSRLKKSNAEHAHDLVGEAMRLLPDSQKKSPNMSMYRHTLGTALMQLNNYTAAAAEFEQALAIRPESVEILESLIDCYDSFNLDSSAYQKKLEEVLAKQDSSE